MLIRVVQICIAATFWLGYMMPTIITRERMFGPILPEKKNAVINSPDMMPSRALVQKMGIKLLLDTFEVVGDVIQEVVSEDTKIIAAQVLKAK